VASKLKDFLASRVGQFKQKVIHRLPKPVFCFAEKPFLMERNWKAKLK
jgi:hypothetical protein